MLAGRLTIPAVEGPVGFADLLTRPAAVLLEATAPRPLAEGGFDDGVVLAIGPEGGWSQAEREAAGEVRLRSLGGLTLRAETAAAAALATALALSR